MLMYANIKETKKSNMIIWQIRERSRTKSTHKSQPKNQAEYIGVEIFLPRSQTNRQGTTAIKHFLRVGLNGDISIIYRLAKILKHS
jgi:hypothetical protein